MALTLMFAALALLIAIGAPISIALGAASLLYVLIEGLPSMTALNYMINGVNSFSLLAVPFFIMAGNLMNSGGITSRIFDFARAVAGWAPGGLGHVNVGASVIFSGMSGAAVADAGGLGNIEIKAMRDAGYETDFAVGITAASSTIGPIIPPSLPLVLYGVTASVSIGDLFLAGIVPGLLMALSLALMVAWYSHRRAYPRDRAFDPRHVWRTFRRAFLPLCTPAIIIGGIGTGVFTPTEAAVAAVVYALVLGLLVYRTLTPKALIRITMDSLETTASIMMIVAGAAIFAWILTANQSAQAVASAVLSLTQNRELVLLLIMLLVLVVGCFMETIAAITILVPVLLPVAQTVGIDPVHLGIIVVLNLMLGLLTPPVGMVLFVLSRVSQVPFEQCMRATLPFLVPLVIVLFLLAFFPQLSLWLPELLNP